MVPPLVVVWFIVVSSASVSMPHAFSPTALSVWECGSSAKLRCESSNDSQRLKAFSLHHRPEKNHEKIPEVLYLNIKSSAYILNREDRRRIFVQNELMNHSATVTITNLQQNDTGLYYCLFYKEGNGGMSDVPGRPKFFLHVEDDEPEACICREYELWLYGVSTAAALLLLGVFVFAGELCKKKKKAPVQPVYEDMREQPPSVRNPY
ncbi:uncharacterized protein [Hoplias malabaricus]|uniref:uncharacterized protein n=1 Tax=Hoplias malabaricus TaxID=27720 RepID=UPI0034620BBF